MIGSGTYYGDGEHAGEELLELGDGVTLEAQVSTETTFKIKQSDTLPALRRQLLDANGNPVNLTLAESAKFIMSTTGGGVVVNAAAVIEDAASGWVRYDWAAVDTTTAGAYRGEFQVTMADGDIVTGPTDTYIKIRITPELGS